MLNSVSMHGVVNAIDQVAEEVEALEYPDETKRSDVLSRLAVLRSSAEEICTDYAASVSFQMELGEEETTS